MPFPRLRPGVTHSSSSWSLGRKIGAVLAFVIGGVVAGASGMMLFAPETPGAFALAPPPESEPVVLSPVAVVAAEVVEASIASKSDSVDRCQGHSACVDVPRADQAPADDRKAVASAPANAPTPDDGVKSVAVAMPVAATEMAASPPAQKGLHEAAFPAIFMVPRAIASVAPGLASTVSAKSIPAMFVASHPIASAQHQLVSSGTAGAGRAEAGRDHLGRAACGEGRRGSATGRRDDPRQAAQGRTAAQPKSLLRERLLSSVAAESVLVLLPLRRANPSRRAAVRRAGLQRLRDRRAQTERGDAPAST